MLGIWFSDLIQTLLKSFPHAWWIWYQILQTWILRVKCWETFFSCIRNIWTVLKVRFIVAINFQSGRPSSTTCSCLTRYTSSISAPICGYLNFWPFGCKPYLLQRKCFCFTIILQNNDKACNAISFVKYSD